MVFPADQARNAFARLHAGAGEQPMVRLLAGPVAAAVHRLDVARPHQQPLVGTVVRERPVFLFAVDRVLLLGAVRSAPEDDPVRPAVAALPIRRDPANGIAREEQHVHPRVAQPLHAAELREVPVLVVTDAEEGFALQPAVGREEVAVRTVADVVAMLLKPVGQRKLVAEPLAGADGQRVVDHAAPLRLAAVGPVETHVGPRPLVPLGVGVDRVVVRPPVVGLPGVVAALKQDVRRPLVAHDEDHVALPIRLVRRRRNRRHPAEVHPAHPVRRNLQRGRRRPTTLMEILFAGLGRGLRRRGQRTKLRHFARAASAVVTGAEHLEAERPRRLRRHHDIDRLARAHTLPRAIALDPR